MKKNNRSDYTINFTRKALTRLSRLTALKEPEAVKMVIAELGTSKSYKRNIAIAYNKYTKFYGLTWTMPIYRQEARNIALPTKEKVQILIAHAGKNLSMKLQLSAETGLRPVELTRLRVKDLDLEHKTVNPTTAKNGQPRTIPLSQNLTTKLNEYIIRTNLTSNDRIFNKLDADHYGKQFRSMRNRLAEKLKDESFKRIRLYDLRHYFCTRKLYDLKNPYTVMVLMGHTKLETTQRYMHLLNLESDEWEVEGTTDKNRAKELLEANFTYQLTTPDGTMLFRKRK